MQLIPCWQTVLVEHVYSHWLFWELCALWIAIYDNRIFLMQMIPCWRTLHFENIFQYSNWFHDEPFTWNASLFIAVDSLLTKSALPKYAMYLCSSHFTRLQPFLFTLIEMQLIPCWRTVHLENINQNLLLGELWASLLCACNLFIPIDSLTSSVPGTYLYSWVEEHVPAIKNAEFECIAATRIK